MRQRLNFFTPATPSRPRREQTARFSYEQVLGTTLELTLFGRSVEAASVAALAELDRLEAVFSRFLPDSELNTWLDRGEAELSDAFAALLREAQRWTEVTNGAFHPGVDALSELWKVAAQRDELPGSEEIARVLPHFRKPYASFAADARTARKTFPYTLNLNAIAKGRIVDLVSQKVMSMDGVEGVLLNIGGDLRHRGRQPVRVEVADAFTVADNAPPSATLAVKNQAVATSGVRRRGFKMRGRWYPHVIDPRSGQPVQQIASATVIAPDCTTADVLATAFCVLEPETSLALADSLNEVGCLLCLENGDVLQNTYFESHLMQSLEG